VARGGFRVFAGNTTHQAEADHLKLAPGQEINDLEITITLDKLHRVGGSLFAIDGRTLNLGELTLTDTTDDSFHFQTTLHDDGTFLFLNVPPGTYLLAARDGGIGRMPADLRGFRPEAVEPIQTNAFAPNSMTVVVGEVDLTDQHLSLKEIPLPPKKKEDDPE
jgi:hypothetical protein